MDGPIVLDPDFREFIDCCIAHDVRFLVVGGWAMAAHGHARATKDIDVWMWLEPANAERMVAAVEQFGFGSAGLTPADLLDPTAVFVMGREPKRIDVLSTIDGVEFDECWSRRVEVDCSGTIVPFLGREDFITNKTASGRLQDLADIDQLAVP
jgi:hypothetical protein